MAQCEEQDRLDVLDLEALPNDVLAEVFRAAGIKDSFKRLACRGSSRLHRAWQRAVGSLSIEGRDITQSDSALIAKYAGLEQLTFGGSRTGLFAPQVVTLIGPSLAGLKRLCILGHRRFDAEFGDAFSVLRVLGGCTQLQRSLEELDLQEDEHSLSEADLCSLQGLAKLRVLRFDCGELDGSLSGAAGVLERLSSLRHLKLDTMRQNPSPDQLAVLPGCMTQLTRLELCTGDSAEDDELAVAVARLTNLQHLDTGYPLMGAAAQQQSLGRLQQLTHLKLGQDSEDEQEPLVVLPQLSSLVELDAGRTPVRNPFPHPSLQKLKAWVIQQDPPPAAAPGPAVQQALPGCPLQELELSADEYEPASVTSLAHLPLLPELRRLKVHVAPDDDGDDEVGEGSYRQLGELLRRQARTLQEVELKLGYVPFEEPFDELPACRVLVIDCASTRTLKLLGACRLPALEVLQLKLDETELSFHHKLPKLGWLGGLPALRRLQVRGCGDLGERLHRSASALLLGRDVDIDICDDEVDSDEYEYWPGGKYHCSW